MATAACITVAGVRSASLPIKSHGSFCGIVAGAASASGSVAWAGSSAMPKAVNWIPNATVPVLNKNGSMAQPWYKFFQEIANRRLGGVDAPTVADVIVTQNAVQASVVSVQQGLVQAGAQVSAITETVNTQTTVSQAASLPGSTQISKLPAYKQQQINGDLL